LLRKLEQLNNDDIKIVPSELLAFELPMQLLIKGQWIEQWLAATQGQSLSLADALDMAEDILTDSTISSKRRNIELEELRGRCGMASFDWNRYIKNLEAEIHAAVDEKTGDPDERLKLELKELLKEADPIKRVRRRAEIASHYRLKIADIEQALKHLDERSKSRQPRRMGLDELFDLPQVGIEYVIPGMLPIGETALLVAGPKAGKSLLAYDAAFAVATGEDRFLGEQVKQGRVLIIQCDESVNTARGRLIKRGFRHEDAANVQFVDSFKITQLDLLEEWLESFRPTLVIVDSLRRINAGRELSENSAEFADAVYQLKELIARYNTAAILIHHTSKNQEAVGVDRVRGSSAIAGAVWGVWQLDHIVKPDPHNKRRMIVDPKDPTRILSIMARDVEGQRLKIELDPENNHWLTLGEVGVEEGEIKERKTHEDEILGLLKPIAPKALEASEINAKLNIGRGVYNCLHRLLAKGIIGSRPSTIDRRRTVYYYPKNDDGDTPPSLPPTPTDQNVIEYAETLTTQALENRSQIDHKSITKKTPKKPVNASKPEQASAPEVDHRNRSQGGERGSAATDSPLAKGQWRMVCTNTGLREGKLIECLGDSWRVKVGMNNLVIPTSHIGNLTS
jgi:KaiC/GvpD/RAD55 family RecA-like ATPase